MSGNKIGKTLDQINKQFRLDLERVQENQLGLKKEQRIVEEQQEAFFHIQQKEQSTYDFVLTNCEPEERSFFEERGEDSLHLAKKAQLELEEQHRQLEKEYCSLLDKEQTIQEEQTAFWHQEAKTNGT